MSVVGTQTYSFRSSQKVFGTIFHADAPESAALSAIEDAVAQGHAAFLGGQYQDAIVAYKQAANLVYAQLHPAGSASVGVISVNPALFAPLLSLGLEWMNVLQPTIPIATSRPRVPVTPDMLGDAVKFDTAGLRSATVDQGNNANAIADWQFSQTLNAQANPGAAQVFLTRAEQEAPDLVKQLQSANGSPAPAAAPHTDALSVTAPIRVGPVVAPSPVVAPKPSVPPTPVVAQNPVIALNPIIAQSPVVFQNPSSVLGGLGRLGVAPVAVAPVPVVPVAPTLTVDRTYGAVIDGEGVKQVSWTVGNAPDPAAVTALIYQPRIGTTQLSDLLFAPDSPADLAVGLPHLYFYVIPLALAECYHSFGDYASAEDEYLAAASYQYLNTTVEAPYLWGRLATLYLDWGNSVFRQGDAAGALPIYSQVINPDDSAPTSNLYTNAALAPGATIAQQVLADLADIATLDLDPDIVSAIAGIRGQIAKIQGGLDFWGFWTETVPIWSFDYLQGVAVNLAQLAVSVERDVINYWSQADQSAMTQQQLVTAASSANAEVNAAQLQVQAAAAQAQSYKDGAALAAKRASDAQAAVGDYAGQSSLAISYQASSQQISGGDDGDPNTLNQLADQLLSGHDISGSGATISAATQLAGAKANQKYELDSLTRQAQEMQLANTQANAEVAAANAQIAAAAASVAVAQIKAQGAQALLSAFNNQTFTPEVWKRMGDALFQLYQRYQTMALYVAKLMQRAYNFETDQSLTIIRTDYSTATVNGLLGSDVLLADIESFTYQLISSTQSKPQPAKQTISLASRYPYSFETQLRATGAIDFQTTLDDFDTEYPGTYAGRITAVEVDVDGIVPTTGISGTLTNSGISTYRTPFSSWTSPDTPTVKYRVQSKETLVLSDYSARNDSLLIQPDSRELRIFEGAGVASTWHLELPKAVNDIDYGALLDVRLTFYYQTRYDPQIAPAVEASLAARPGFTDRQRSLPLRWIYPDAFFSFQATGQLGFTLTQRDFPHSQTNPQLNAVGVLVATDGTVPAGGLVVGLATPATPAAVKATLDGRGRADSTTGGSPLAPLAAGAALGSWTVSIDAADNPSLVTGGVLKLGPIVNIAVLMDYSFTPRS
jgi:Tc toxin complex TcA C-terminal TcB-binding domain